MNTSSCSSPVSACAAFSNYHDSWFAQLQQLVKELRQEQKEDVMEKVLWHHQNYYKVKSLAAEKDPLNMLASPWATTLERSLLWITGWRPTTAFHLIYTESSLLFESHVINILQGLRTGDLGDLSPSQFGRVSDLQCLTVKEENALTDELSEWQDNVSEMMGPGLGAVIDEKIEGLVDIIKRADDLRLRTLSSVVDMLTPQQSIEFLIGSTELLVGIRGWGLNHDHPSGN